MWVRTIVLGQLFVCLCSSSGLRFSEDNTSIKLRSYGSNVNIGHVHKSEHHDHESYNNKVVLKFKQLKFMTPSHYDIFATSGTEHFDINSGGFRKFRDIRVHGMAMLMNISALGILLNIKTAISKRDATLPIGDGFSTDIRHGDVIVSLELTPGRDEETDCIACQLDNGHVILLELEIAHAHLAETGDVVRTDNSPLRSIGYSDETMIYIPEKVIVDGTTQDAELDVGEYDDNKLRVVFRLPTPLGQSMEVDLIFRMQEPTEQPPTTPRPEPDIVPDDVIRDVDERSRDDANEADREAEPQVIEIKHTTTKTLEEEEYNAIAAAKEEEKPIGAATSHVISILVFLTTAALCIL